MPDLTLTGLRVVYEVGRRGSFTAAARALGYTQSAISRQVSLTEHALGVELFQRLPRDRAAATNRRIAGALRLARSSLTQGVPDAVLLLRRRSPGVLLGSLGTVAFDIAVLGACFRAFGHAPPFGVLVFGYLIGQLGGNLPTPGGIGGVDVGLVGMFTLYHQPIALSTAAVLTYHAIALWVPGLLGSLAFVQLRRTLKRESRPAVICTPLAESIATVP